MKIDTSMSHENHVSIIDYPREYKVMMMRVLAPSKVYHPHKESSTIFLLSALPDVSGLDVLEIGGGTGALSLYMRNAGAKKVVVTDLSARACATMECNAMINNLDIDVRQGDLFSVVSKEEVFDLIVFNLPMLDAPITCESEIALCDTSGNLLNKFSAKVSDYLKNGGKALFTHSNISAPLPNFNNGKVSILSEYVKGNGDIFRCMQFEKEDHHE